MGKKNDTISNDEVIKNLLIIYLLKEGVNPQLIGKAIGIPEITIRAKFPMKLIKSGTKQIS